MGTSRSAISELEHIQMQPMHFSDHNKADDEGSAAEVFVLAKSDGAMFHNTSKIR